MSTIDAVDVSYDLMEYASGNGVSYSTILNNESMIKKYGNLTILLQNLRRLIAFGLVKTIPVYSDQEGDDYKIQLTDTGESFLKINRK